MKYLLKQLYEDIYLLTEDVRNDAGDKFHKGEILVKENPEQLARPNAVLGQAILLVENCVVAHEPTENKNIEVVEWISVEQKPKLNSFVWVLDQNQYETMARFASEKFIGITVESNAFTVRGVKFWRYPR